jgi:hypothetical protein
MGINVTFSIDKEEEIVGMDRWFTQDDSQGASSTLKMIDSS